MVVLDTIVIYRDNMVDGRFITLVYQRPFTFDTPSKAYTFIDEIFIEVCTRHNLDPKLHGVYSNMIKKE